MKSFNKLIIVAATFLFSAQALGYEQVKQIVCTGQTYEGQTYRVRVQYGEYASWFEEEAPYAIEAGERAFVQVKAWENGNVIFNDATYTNDIMFDVTDDQMVYSFNELTLKKSGSLQNNKFVTEITNYVRIAPTPAEASGGDDFSFSVKGAWGNFKNGNCKFKYVQ